jgi:hypothetical protein
MFNTAKQKASSLRWPQPEFAAKDDSSEKSTSSAAPEPSSHAGGQGTPSQDTERDELPVLSPLPDVTTAVNRSMAATDISKTSETFNKFKEQEVKLQE